MTNILKILNLVNDFIKEYKIYLIILIIFFTFITVIKKCEKEPKVITNTVTKVIKVHDTITKVKIDTIYTRVNVEKIKTIKGETKIVYIDTTTKESIEAKQYNTELLSNQAKADLKITTTGELLDVQGIIEYPKETKTITNTIVKHKNKSGLFLYGNVPVNRNVVSPEVGLMYQFKNTVGVMGGIEYDNISKTANMKVGLAFRIF